MTPVSHSLSKLSVASRTEAVALAAGHRPPAQRLTPPPLNLPQVAEANTPRRMDVAGECPL